ncbi:MAG: hypothetical protein KIH08_09810 [Candidatus Freyarchaeota archaeon]|nr:hypothetical protein [Candidatus Jordarchaeia archaeon]MBS7269704.1 hypothetical protein [Candidatus Jordarchaeia archaeon]MBS7280226.1 hypothetical protein [Candidatus Jordarchaeia archaeon]
MKTAEKSREKQPKNDLEEQLELEAELYSCIATLDMLGKNYDNGLIDASTYSRQMRAYIQKIIDVRKKLEEKGFDLTNFIEQEKIIENYPNAAVKLRIVKSDETVMRPVEEIPLEIVKFSPAKLATETADLVTNFITLIDCVQLGDYARVDNIVPIMDDIILLMENYTGLNDKNYWVYKEITAWRDRLKNEPPDLVIDSEDAKKIEYDAVRWFKDFRQRIRQL